MYLALLNYCNTRIIIDKTKCQEGSQLSIIHRRLGVSALPFDMELTVGLVVLPIRGRRMTRGVVGGRVGVTTTESGVDPLAVAEAEAVDLEGVARAFFLPLPTAESASRRDLFSLEAADGFLGGSGKSSSLSLRFRPLFSFGSFSSTFVTSSVAFTADRRLCRRRVAGW